MTKKITTADLMRELDALKKEVAALKAAPAQRIEHHYHYHYQPSPQPQPYRPYAPWWGTTTITATPTDPKTWTVWCSDNKVTQASYEPQFVTGLSQAVTK